MRKLLLLPLDDLLVLARTFLNSNLSRSTLDRCLRRHRVSNLRALRVAMDRVAIISMVCGQWSDGRQGTIGFRFMHWRAILPSKSITTAGKPGSCAPRGSGQRAYALTGWMHPSAVLLVYAVCYGLAAMAYAALAQRSRGDCRASNSSPRMLRAGR